MKSLRTFVCLAGSVALFGTGCGGAPEEMNPEPSPLGEVEQRSEAGVVYSICWPALGVYAGPGTGYPLMGTLYHDQGDQFYSDSNVFSSNGDYWIRGTGWAWNRGLSPYGYVRWNGLCH
ncbi:hypothetical protein HPC49_04305 [Pyxidicoccus fallax]|uniref:SH3 domain-containing protein n=1 Tax=Pyxidicoccus fallax TaxID=394095 RepID=A0A848LGK2_9BACT|nr:SH3 domain-containing protein [Pyxidicoccus fallax]NMO15128.1 SH3 domain-containing protein [Pyxidicoccus fallax]NPC77474.1 hypothetical protein [Pyxidicoccus fallax]